MIIKTVLGEVEVAVNQHFFDISHPYGAIRRFVTKSEPILEGKTVIWTAVSDDCYSEQLEFQISSERSEQNLLFPDYASANRYLSVEDIRIQLSSLEYSLLISIDILCGDSSVEYKLDKIKEISETFDLHVLVLKLRLESYEMFGLNELDDISALNKLCLDDIIGMNNVAQAEHCEIILSSIGRLKDLRERLIKLKDDFLLSYDVQ